MKTPGERNAEGRNSGTETMPESWPLVPRVHQTLSFPCSSSLSPSVILIHARMHNLSLSFPRCLLTLRALSHRSTRIAVCVSERARRYAYFRVKGLPFSVPRYSDGSRFRSFSLVRYVLVQQAFATAYSSNTRSFALALSRARVP